MHKLCSSFLLTSMMLSATPCWSAPLNFIDGLHVGINAGAQTNSFHGIEILSTPTLGAHLDYYYALENKLFMGFGLEHHYALDRSSATSSFQLLNLGSVGYYIKRPWTTAFSVAVGTVHGPAAFNISLAAVATHAVATLNFFGTTVQHDTIAGGIAPGAGVTFNIAPDVTLGAIYRYEMFPYSIHSHSVSMKLSLRI